MTPTPSTTTELVRVSDPRAEKNQIMATYVEPELYVAASQTADSEGRSNSNWIRKLIIRELAGLGRLTQDQLVRLAETS